MSGQVRKQLEKVCHNKIAGLDGFSLTDISYNIKNSELIWNHPWSLYLGKAHYVNILCLSLHFSSRCFNFVIQIIPANYNGPIKMIRNTSLVLLALYRPISMSVSNGGWLITSILTELHIKLNNWMASKTPITWWSGTTKRGMSKPHSLHRRCTVNTCDLDDSLSLPFSGK